MILFPRALPWAEYGSRRWRDSSLRRFLFHSRADLVAAKQKQSFGKEVEGYGWCAVNAAIVCEDCQEVLVDFDEPTPIEDAQQHVGCDIIATEMGSTEYDGEAQEDGFIIVDFTSGDPTYGNYFEFYCEDHKVRLHAEGVDGV